MKVVKPNKVPVCSRVLERSGQELHVAAMIGFSLGAPRELVDEVTLWKNLAEVLHEVPLDEGFVKARAEVLLAGAFHAPGGVATPTGYVRARVGAFDKRLAVVGDRRWNGDGTWTAPEVMTTMPLDWAHAFGSSDYARNPYGKGLPVEESAPTSLPNVEPYGALLRSRSDRPEPAGFLPMDVTFAQRRARAGTYDQAWLERDYPGLPRDASPDFFNVAPPDQWITGFLRGDESFVVENMHPTRPRIEGALPGLVLRAFIRRAGDEALHEVAMRLDTLWLLPGAMFGVLIAHGSAPVVEDDAEDVTHLLIACEEMGAPRSLTHYAETLARRLDKDHGALADLSDSDLMPDRGSGVAANLGETDIGRWVRSSNLHGQRLRRGAERRRLELRAMVEGVEGESLDPADYGLAEPLPELVQPPLDDLDALAEFVRVESLKADKLLEDAKAEQVRAKAQMRDAFAAMGEDFDAFWKKAEETAGGPPRFDAAAMLEQLEQAAEVSERDRAQLKAQGEGFLEMYRKFGHLQPPAPRAESAAAEQMRVLVLTAVEAGESLAQRDLTGVRLADLDLRAVDLRESLLELADLSGCVLEAPILEGAMLARAKLSAARIASGRLAGINLGGADLRAAVLDGCDLTGAVLSGADLAGARLSTCTITNADLHETKLAGANLTGSSLAGATIIKTDLRGACFVETDLAGATFVECDLTNVDLSGAKLEKASFIGCVATGVVLRGARMKSAVLVHGSRFDGADFCGAEMTKANLRGTNIIGARFDGAVLDGADLSSCDATGATFDGASLKGALLTRTSFVGASLTGVNLMDALASKANLAGANLSNSNLYRADLARIRRDDRTTLEGAELGRARLVPKASKPGSIAS